MLQNRINQLIELIDLFVDKILNAGEGNGFALIGALTTNISMLFPDIVDVYEKPEMAEYKEDQLYWVDQLSRITEAIESNDCFRCVDVLKYETAVNLRELQRIMKEKGI